MTVLRFAVAPLFAVAFFVAFSHTLPVAQSLLPAREDVGLPVFVGSVALQAAILNFLCGAVFGAALARVYGRYAAVAAIVCVAPVALLLALRGVEQTRDSLLTQATIVIWIVSLTLIVPWTTWMMSRLECFKGDRHA